MTARLAPMQQRVLESIKRRQPVARRDLAAEFGVAPATMSEHLDALRLAGVARPSGRGRNTTWSVHRQAPAVNDIFSMARAMGAS